MLIILFQLMDLKNILKEMKKFLKKAMEKRRAAVYPLTAGFVLGALLEVFPGLPPLNYLPLCVCLAAAGLYMALRFSFYTYQ